MSLLSNPWMQIGMGLLANSGPSLTPVNPWRGIGQGLMAANEAKAMEQQQAYEQRRMEMEQQKYDAEQARQRQMQSIIQSLPPDQQQLAMADPDAFFDARIKQQFAAPKDANLPAGWQMGANGQAQMIPGYQPEKPPQTSGIRLTGPSGEPIIAASVEEAQSIISQNPGVKFYQPPPSTVINNNSDGALPANFRWVDPNDKSQGVEPIPGGPATKPTEGQGLAAGFYDRMNSASEIIDALEESGYDPSTVAHAAVPDMIAPPETQQYRQAQRDWVRSKLRKESGAVISEKEMADEIKTFFPQPNDSPKVIAQKRRARAIAERAMYKQAGPGNVDEPSPRPAPNMIPPPPPGAVIDQ